MIFKQTDPVAPRVDFIEGVLSKQGIRADSTILDAGCGTGRYAIELTRRGYHVWGADRSKKLLAIAQNRALDAAVHVDFVIADLLVVTFTRLFDAVLCRGVLNDVVDESDRATIFRQLAAWLRPGGIAIFDVRDWARTVARRTEDNGDHHFLAGRPERRPDSPRSTAPFDCYRGSGSRGRGRWRAFGACSCVRRCWPGDSRRRDLRRGPGRNPSALS